MAFDLTGRQQRWLSALLVLATVAAGFVVFSDVAQVFYYFGDTILVFFLAWLLAFILSPIVAGVVRAVPRLPRVGAVILVYVALLAVGLVFAVLAANALARSISEFVAGVPHLRTELPTLVAPWQERLAAVGLGQVDLQAQAGAFLDNLSQYASQLAGPVQQLAVASLGALGSLFLVLVLSLYMVIDRDRILAFLFRLVPPAYKDEARLLETSVGRSFGGFLRGQAVMGLAYGAIAAATSLLLGLDFMPITATTAGVLQAIPFFGPFVSWAPPVLVAILVRPDATLPAFVLMAAGWFVVMNVLQPRLMAEAVGIHPIVVLGSVLVGGKIGGVAGAIFGIPIAAVLSAFFFHALGRSVETGPVAARAAHRLAAREGHAIRLPREPQPGVDADVDEPAAVRGRMAHPGAAARTGSMARPGPGDGR